MDGETPSPHAVVVYPREVLILRDGSRLAQSVHPHRVATGGPAPSGDDISQAFDGRYGHVAEHLGVIVPVLFVSPVQGRPFIRVFA